MNLGQMSLFPETLCARSVHVRRAYACNRRTYTGPVLSAVMRTEDSVLLSSVNLLTSLHTSKEERMPATGGRIAERHPPCLDTTVQLFKELRVGTHGISQLSDPGQVTDLSLLVSFSECLPAKGYHGCL